MPKPKTLRQIKRQDKEKLRYIRSVQDAIPIETIYPDGLFLVKSSGKGAEKKYSMTLSFTDVSYSIASGEDQETMFFAWEDFINSLDPGATWKLTVMKRRISRSNIEQYMIHSDDAQLQPYQEEYNKMLEEKALGDNGMMQELYLTGSICKKDITSARNYFARAFTSIQSILSDERLGSQCRVLSGEERLKLFHDFYRAGEENDFFFHISDSAKKGHSFKDYIAPDHLDFTEDHFKFGAKYGRVLLLRDYAANLKDSFVSEMCGELEENLVWSMDLIPIPTDEAMQEAENRAMSVEGNIIKYLRKQSENSNFTGILTYDMEQQRKESKEYMDDLSSRDQRMLFGVITMVHTADTKEQLDNDTDALLSTARKNLCQMSTLRWQQMDGLNTALPYGLRKIDAIRTLTTESVAVFLPFKAQEIQQEGGRYYGQNAVSHNLVMINKDTLMNRNCIILGVPGSGKSFCGKRISITEIFDPGNDVILIDPEREYSPMVRAMGGEVVDISATSQNHINAMDINGNYDDGDNPITLKSEFIISLCEQVIGSGNMGPKQKSIVDRCLPIVYQEYVKNGYTGTPPTLLDFHATLLAQEEPEAKDIALALELFTKGSLDTFSKQTNVDTKSSFLCYDIADLGEQLRATGMLVVLDSILNRVSQNRAAGRKTSIYIDEFYLMFLHEYTAEFFYKLWKRARKYNADCTGITQNVEDLLESHTARTMLANSEFIIMLNQFATDRMKLAKLLNISDSQLSYVTNAKQGCGLLKFGKNLIPFEDDFPKDTQLYRLMTTKPGEAIY